MSLVTGEKTNFQFILRLLNTNVSKIRHIHAFAGQFED